MSKKNWVRFERLVAAIHLAESQGAEVKWNDKIEGRQFDVTLRFKHGLHEYLTVIECKDYNGKIPVEKVDALVTKARDVKANEAIMVSSNGYQSGCYEVAKRHGISLLTLNEKFELDQSSLFKEVTPALNIYDVRFIQPSGEEILLEDEGGSLHYHMTHIQLVSKTREINPNQLINEWQLDKPYLDAASASGVLIKLEQGTIAMIPYEESVEVVSIKFKCKMIQAFIPNQPLPDMHIMEGMRTRYELQNEHGEIVHTALSPEVKLGFDTQVIPGKFYVNPRLHIFYYCEAIDKNIVTWIIVESYQHGQLLRTIFRQDIKYSCYYLEVTDKKSWKNLTDYF